MRCGTGLFISGDLLCPGPIELSLVSLRNSMAGLAMARRQPVVVTAPVAGAAGSARQVVCLPVALHPTSNGSDGGQPTSPSSTHDSCPPLYVGALMVGAGAAGGSVQPAPPDLWAGLQALAGAVAPYLLLLGLEQAEQMGDLLRLGSAEALSCSSDEAEPPDDATLEAPHRGLGGAGSALTPDAHGPSSEPQPAEPTQATAAAGSVAQQLAAAAVLSQRSKLAGGGAAGRSGGGSSSRTQQGDAAPAAGAQQGTGEEGRDGGDAQEPKAEVKHRQACAAQAPPLAPAPTPRGLLLRFAAPATEARYAAAYNRSLASSDALFAAMHLCAAVCLAALHPSALAGSRAVLALVAALLVPLLAPALGSAR